MKNNLKVVVLIVIIIFLLIIIFFQAMICFNCKKAPEAPVAEPTTKTTGITPSVKEKDPEQPPIENAVKCQNVVVTPGKTIELFEYTSGKKFKADYRVSSMNENEPNKYQILYDGEWLYVWSEYPKYDWGSPTETPPAYKARLSAYEFKNDISKLDEVTRFSETGFSGERLCKAWDDVDPVFEVPDNVKFVESEDTLAKSQEFISKMCGICNYAKTDEAATSCKMNLGC